MVCSVLVYGTRKYGSFLLILLHVDIGNMMKCIVSALQVGNLNLKCSCQIQVAGLDSTVCLSGCVSE